MIGPLQVMAAAVQVHQDITKSGQRVTRHLEAWRRYSDIWRSDQAALLDKFKAKAPTCAAFEEKFSKFKKVRRPLQAFAPSARACWCRACMVQRIPIHAAPPLRTAYIVNFCTTPTPSKLSTSGSRPETLTSVSCVSLALRSRSASTRSV